MFSHFQHQDTLLALTKDGDMQKLSSFADRLWRQGDYDDAIAAYRARAQLSPDDGSALLSLAKAVSNFEYEEPVFRRLTEHCSAHPDDTESIHFLCQSQIGRVHHDAILSKFVNAIQATTGPAYRPLLLFYQSLLVLIGQDDPASLASFASHPRELAQIQSLLLCNQAKKEARVFGLPIDLLNFSLQNAPASGLYLECGVYYGKSIRVIADKTREKVFGFDSFAGLPEDWKEGEGKGSYSTGGKLPAVPENVQLIPGWFEHTLPAFFSGQDSKIAVLHVDCDLYSSTKTILENCRPHLQPGTVIIFDDLLGYPGWENHEWKAFVEFTKQYAIRFRFLAFVFLSREVAIQIL